MVRIFTIMLLVCCYFFGLSQTRTVISGKINKPESEELILVYDYVGPFTAKKMEYKIDSVGKFKYIFDLFYPVDAGLSSENNEVAFFYLYPGDSLVIDIVTDSVSAASKYPNYSFTTPPYENRKLNYKGKGSELNNYLENKANLDPAIINEDVFNAYVNNYASFYKLLIDDVEKQINQLKGIIKNSGNSDKKILKDMRDIFEIEAGIKMIQFLNNIDSTSLYEKGKNEKYRQFYNYFDSIIIDDINVFHMTPDYPAFLEYYLWQIKAETKEEPKDIFFKTNYISDINKIISFLKGKNRDYYMFFYLFNKMNAGNILDIDPAYRKFNATCSNQTYIARLEKKREECMKHVNDPKFVNKPVIFSKLNNNSDTLTLKDILAKCEGRVSILIFYSPESYNSFYFRYTLNELEKLYGDEGDPIMIYFAIVSNEKQ